VTGVQSKALRFTAVLILAASQTAIAERALARTGGSGMSGGSHFVATGHFAHVRFGHRLRKNPVFSGPYGWGWDWPYADYGEAPPYGNTTIVAYPPPLAAAHAANNCRWDAQTFTVPASAGGTRPVEVMSCR
jgi:hypothetical protein